MKKIAHFRNWEIKNNNRWALYDYQTGQLKGTCKAMKGDMASMPELSAEIKSWENLTKADAIMDECKKRAKAAYPDYFKNPRDVLVTNGGTITKAFRGQTNLVNTIFQSYIVHGYKEGYKYTCSVAVDPRVMQGIQKNGGKILAEDFYDEPGHIWSIPTEYFKTVPHICKQYQNGRPSVRFLMTDIVNHEASKFAKL